MTSIKASAAGLDDTGRMDKFRIAFVDHAGRPFSHESFEAESDQNAIVLARKVFKCGIGDGYNIWHGSTLIHIENRHPG